MKLLIAVPAHDYIHTDFVNCFLKLIDKLKRDGIDFEYNIMSGTLVYIARDKLARYAINNGFTHVLWLDADMIFEDTLLDDLMFCGKDFVTGIAHARRKPYLSCVFKSLSTCEHFTEYGSEPFKVAGCGFACVLIKVDILTHVMLTFQTCFLPQMKLGEDLAFCDRAHYCGYEIWAEPTVRLGHIGQIAIYPEDHERYMEQIVRE